MSETGTITISVEIELGWSLARTSKLTHISPRREIETEALQDLLSLCERYDIPITFDVVGHLMTEQCSGVHDGPHDQGWFDIDPGSNLEEDPLFYAPDLINAIQRSPVSHEIATHTFSHVLLDEMSPEIAKWELQRCQALHEEYGEDFQSLVTPRHCRCDPDVAASEGIDIIRMPATNRQNPSKESLLDAFGQFVFDPPVSEPILDGGIVYTYSSRYPSLAAPFLPAGHGPPPKLFSVVPKRLRERFSGIRLAHGVKRAARQKSCVHYWSHLYDISPKCQRRPLEGFFATIDRYRNQGSVTVETMAELNERVRYEQSSEEDP